MLEALAGQVLIIGRIQEDRTFSQARSSGLPALVAAVQTCKQGQGIDGLAGAWHQHLDNFTIQCIGRLLGDDKVAQASIDTVRKQGRVVGEGH
ncbi:hypothetical protein A0257_19725 [Hymenobacter psoromatis]|nr:hypothetical protein A0257_19725 [Hymenobacter psoromatis]